MKLRSPYVVAAIGIALGAVAVGATTAGGAGALHKTSSRARVRSVAEEEEEFRDFLR